MGTVRSGSASKAPEEIMFFVSLVYVSGYLFLVFIAVCLACGLYYMAELAEEYPTFTKKIIFWSIVCIVLVHPFLCILESFPILPVAFGLATHGMYYRLLEKEFPFIELTSPNFLGSCAMMVGSHYFWISHFNTTSYPITYVMGFFFTCVWLVPFAYFISLSINEFVLPCEFPSYKQQQQDSYTQGGEKKRKGGFLSLASWFSTKKSETLQEHAPPSWHMQKNY